MRAATGFLIAAFALIPLQSSRAADVLALYVGASITQSQVKASGAIIRDAHDTIDDTGTFNEQATGFKVLAGFRPISFLGAELSYMDFGRPSGSFNSLGAARVTMTGASAFGVLYLPVPFVDVFAKAGVARIESSVRSTAVYSPCGFVVEPCALYLTSTPFNLDRTNSGFAAGAGAQLKFGPWAIRAEYERFTAAGAHPSLLSLGFTWSFL